MSEWRFKLLYDGGGPFCRREMRWLQRWNRHGHLAFEDVAAPSFDPARYGVTRERVMGVIHGVFPDGRIVRKMEVFRQAYRDRKSTRLNSSHLVISYAVFCLKK